MTTIVPAPSNLTRERFEMGQVDGWAGTGPFFDDLAYAAGWFDGDARRRSRLEIDMDKARREAARKRPADSTARERRLGRDA